MIRVFAYLSVLCTCHAAAFADYTIAFTLSPGGMAASGPFSMQSVIGQPTLSSAQSGASVAFHPGFLFVEPGEVGRIGDIDGSGSVNGVDLAYLLSDWGTANSRSDLNRDGSVAGEDLSILLANWG